VGVKVAFAALNLRTCCEGFAGSGFPAAEGWRCRFEDGLRARRCCDGLRATGWRLAKPPFRTLFAAATAADGFREEGGGARTDTWFLLFILCSRSARSLARAVSTACLRSSSRLSARAFSLACASMRADMGGWLLLETPALDALRSSLMGGTAAAAATDAEGATRGLSVSGLSCTPAALRTRSCRPRFCSCAMRLWGGGGGVSGSYPIWLRWGGPNATSPAAGGVRGVSPRQPHRLPAPAAEEHLLLARFARAIPTPLRSRKRRGACWRASFLARSPATPAPPLPQTAHL
jgi:hypothetical protein